MIHIRIKIYLTIVLLIFYSGYFFSIIAQTGVRNNGAKIIITEGAILYIDGDATADYTNQTYNSTHGRIDLDGKIILEGDWYNNATSGYVLENMNDVGEVWMTGSMAQTIGGTRTTYFEDLVIDKSNMVLLAVTTNVFDSLVLNNGLVQLGTYHLILGSSAKLDGSPSATSMVIATSTGMFIKRFSEVSSFTYPVGDNTGTAEYSPVTVDFNSGTYGALAYVGVRLSDSKHASNTSTSNYLSRYWTLTPYNISSYSADITMNYVDADIAGIEDSIYGARWYSPNWFLLNQVNSGSNQINATVSNFYSSYTGGEQSAFSVSIALSDNMIEEGNEDAGEIYVTLTNDDFVSTFTQSAWTVTKLPVGVSKGSVVRTGTKKATIQLTGNRTRDYDTDITNVTVQIDGSQLVYSSSSVSANTGVLLDATDDAESIALSDNVITEGNENGRVIGVKLTGGTFTTSLTTGSWVISNLPEGVSVGSIQRISIDSVAIVLSGNRSVDYDSDITNVSVSIPGADVDDYGGTTISANSGVLFDAYDDPESISMENRDIILEASEDGAILDVTLTGGTFVDPINPANWTLANLPVGVSKGTITRTSSITATIELSGNRTVNYDEDITNATLTINADQVDDLPSGALSVNTGVVFTAVDEGLIVHLYDDGDIQEGSENGEVISVALGYPKEFISILNPDSFVFSNLPVGVTKGTITRVADDSITIVLNGNRIKDYDANITNTSIRIDSSQIANSSSDGIGNSGITFIAIADNPETISLSSNSIYEGSEDGDTIIATVSNGTFATSINKNNWALSNLPAGVTIGSVIKSSPTVAHIILSGNRTTDFDVSITGIALTVTASEVDDHTSGNIISGNSVTITAVIDDESISISDNGINESHESEGVIYVEVIGGTLVPSINPDNWTVLNLPDGVYKQTVTKTDGNHVQILLSGNRLIDYDSDISNIGVAVEDDQIDEYTGIDLVDSSGVVIHALNDPESLVMSDDGSIEELYEDGEQISVEIDGGTFALSINPVAWSFDILPDGVSIDDITRISDTTVMITLAGTRETDYDQNIQPVLTVEPTEFYDNSGFLSASTGVTFNADDDGESLMMYDDGSILEGYEDGEQIEVLLSGGTFVSIPDEGEWTLDYMPAGVSIDTVILNDRTSATIILEGTRTLDYDLDISNATLTIAESQIDDLSGYDLSVSTGIEFTATIESASIQSYNVDSLNENNLDTATILITLENDQFVDGTLNPVYFSLNNAPAGSSVEYVSWVSSTNALLGLAFDGSDFDIDITDFSVTIQGEELVSMGDITSNDTTIYAMQESQSAIISHSGLTESNLDGAQIELELVNDIFADASLSPANFSLVNAPAGTFVDLVQYNSSTSATITLTFGGVDFDTDIPDFAILISGLELSSGKSIMSNTLTITAVIETESLVITHAGLTEENLDGAIVDIQLVEETFVDPTLEIANITIQNAPNGLSINGINYVDTAHATIELSFDGTDFDNNFNTGLSIAASELSKGVMLTSNSLLIEATDDIESITMADDGEIHEGAEDGEIITVTLAGGTFIGTLNPDNWTLSNLPVGVTKGTVTRINSTEATLALSGNRTEDYAVNITDVTLTINASEVDDHTGDPLIASSGVILIADGVGMEEQESLKIYIYSYKDIIYIQNNMPSAFEARAVVYNLLGQAVIEAQLNPVSINTIQVPWLTNEYIIKLYVGDQIYSQKVFINVE
ncbi:MAG: hypothetical protein JXB49_35620 [Bacteroidales bacterium]|nr:hypothetical protein [Bacteroidales bacterium]